MSDDHRMFTGGGSKHLRFFLSDVTTIVGFYILLYLLWLYNYISSFDAEMQSGGL